MTLTLVTGGTRSGKSARAEALAAATGRPVRYIATADPADPSMGARIAAHVARRPAGWATVQAPPRLADALDPDDGSCVLVDGLGGWLACALEAGGAFETGAGETAARVREAVLADLDALGAAAARIGRDVIVVAEEAGQGMLPGDRGARVWLDLLGESVQRLAARAQRVELVVAGRPVALAGAPPQLRFHGDQRGGGGVSVIAVVGIGADGWAGLGEPAREAILSADVIVGSERQLALLPDTPATRRAWPSPIGPLVDELVADGAEETVCVLASGDPMLHGIGATLARRLDPSRLAVHPHPSAFSLVCARLGWPASEVRLASAVGRPPEVLAPLLQPGRRIVAYVAGAGGAAAAARVLCERGFGPSRLVVCEQLGGPGERIVESTAEDWGERLADPLHTIAIEPRAAQGALVLGPAPGLPDEAYESDGQLTKWPARAMTLAALRPGPGLLWDVGAGSGSIAIEWLRADAQARAIAIEERADRAARIRANALRLGVPQLSVQDGSAPAALTGLETPDAVFVGGGVSIPGLLDRCWERLRRGGRIVASAVTLEGEQALHAARAAHGGALLRLAVSHAEPLGGFEAWRPQLPVVQWSADKP
jgi:precorrin-6B C5,15-methyltransferase / cobalt-precorrin-6B C5,C15-methyltransferase